MNRKTKPGFLMMLFFVAVTSGATGVVIGFVGVRAGVPMWLRIACSLLTTFLVCRPLLKDDDPEEQDDSEAACS